MRTIKFADQVFLVKETFGEMMLMFFVGILIKILSLLGEIAFTLIEWVILPLGIYFLQRQARKKNKLSTF